MLSYDKYKCR